MTSLAEYFQTKFVEVEVLEDEDNTCLRVPFKRPLSLSQTRASTARTRDTSIQLSRFTKMIEEPIVGGRDPGHAIDLAAEMDSEVRLASRFQTLYCPTDCFAESPNA